jgi:pyrimidine-specific ribonucleoside hydrolase
MKKLLVCLLPLMFGAFHFVQAQTKKPVPVIFDTDIGPDYDDVGAITLFQSP